MKRRKIIFIWSAAAGLVGAAAAAWLFAVIGAERVDLTAEERAWLDKHDRQIRIAPLPSSPPIDFVGEDGLQHGLTFDYFQLIERRLGITFSVVRCDSWEEIIEKLKNREVDLVGSVQNTEERREFLSFTEPYLSIPNIIITRKSMPGPYRIRDLANLSIAIVNRSATHDRLVRRFPNYKVVPVKDAETGFQMVSFEEVDVMIADQGVASHCIAQLGISNLKAAGDINYPWKLCFASRKDWPMLNRILNKALESISWREHQQIKHRWITLSDTQIVARDKYLRIIGLVLLLALLVVGGIVVWNQMLRRKINRRTRELGEAQEGRVQVAQALGRSEARYRALVESSSDMIWEVDRQGCFVYVSPKAFDMLGYSPEELMGRRFSEVMGAEGAGNVVSLIRSKLENGEAIEALVSASRHKSGELVFIETSAVPVRDESAQIQGYRGIGRNITARRRAEDELLRLRSLLTNVINSMPSILVGVNPEGNVTQWNRRAEETTGLPHSRAVSKPLDQVFPQLSPHLPKVKQAIAGRCTLLEERWPVETDEGCRFHDITVYPLLDPAAEGAVIRVDDVTDRVQLEKMMVQTEKMLSVGGLAAGMAHEINNPLAGILQNMQVMKNRVLHATPTNDEAARVAGTSLDAVQAYLQHRGVFDMMESVSDAGRRAAKIVDNMLSFSRKDSAAYAPENLADILERSIELASNDYDLKTNFDFRHIRITREYDESIGAVSCEANQIQQVILNLLNNGAQAMAEWGLQQEPAMRVCLRRERNMARIEIEDNGPGMDEETRRRVFEPFFTTKNVGSGTGLGLSVSYFIITENHRGTMEVDSRPGHGTCFRIRIPLKRDPPLGPGMLF